MGLHYRTLEYYEELYARLEKRKDFLKDYINAVKTIGSGSKCLFACSFLCCCCYSRCGKDALYLSEFSRHWATALEKAYGRQDHEKIRKIFREALDILLRTRKKVYERGHFAESSKYSEWLKNQNETLYKIQEIYNDAWMHRIFHSLYNIICISLQMDYSLSPQEVDKLFVAMPLFYPVVYRSEEFSFSMNDNVLEAIRRMIV